MRLRRAAAVLLLALVGCPRPQIIAKRTDLGTQPPWFPAERCQTVTPSDRTACYKDWTVLIYMAADNDLFPYAQLNLYEMEAQESGGGGRSASTERLPSIMMRIRRTFGPSPWLRFSISSTPLAVLWNKTAPLLIETPP